MKIPFDPASLSPALYWLYRTWCGSLRYRNKEQLEVLQELQHAGKPAILALWHDEIFPLTGCSFFYDFRFVTFVSQSKDGEVIARVLERMGHTTARGSNSRGGVRALLRAKRIMEKENRIAVFTVDGPRGPRHQSKDGPIFLAHRVGAVIVPIRAKLGAAYVFDKSWDRFQVPYPFSTVDVTVGEPYNVTVDDLDESTLTRERQRLENRLDELL